MRLLTAHLENFRSVEELTLDFKAEGLQGIIGRPGAGKSSVFGGLMFSLYGTSGPDLDLLDLRYDQAAAGASVVADYTWSHDGTVYRTRRELKRGNRKGKPVEKASAAMWRDGVEIDGMTPTEMTKQVIDITGMNERSYAGSSLIRQGEVDILTTAPPSAVQELVEAHTGIGDISRLRDEARKRHNEAKAVAEAIPGSLDLVQTSAEELAAAEDAASAIVATAEAAQAKALRARTNWEQANTKADQLRQHAQQSQQAREVLISERGALTAAQEAADAADAALTTLEMPADVDPADIDTRLEELSKQRADAADAGNAVHYARQALTAAERDTEQAAEAARAAGRDRPTLLEQIELTTRQIETSTAARDTAAVQAATAQAAIDQLTKSLDTLHEEHAQCPTCGQGIGDAAALISALSDQRAASTQAAAEATAQQKQHAHSVRDLEQRLADVRGRIDQIDKLAAAADQATQRLMRARTDSEHAAGLCARLLGVDTCDHGELLAATRTYIDGVDRDLQRLGEQRAALHTARTAWEQVRRARSRVEQAQASLTEAPNPADVDNAIATSAQLRVTADTLAAESTTASAEAHAAQMGCAQLRTAAQTAALQWKNKQESVRDAEIAGTVAAVLAAYRQDLIADFCDGISAAATELLERFGGEHVAFHLDADFVPRVELADGRLRKTSSLSGGEKARVGLAFRLGISMQISNNTLPDQILGDEITSYLDEDGRRQVVSTIAQLFGSPIIVSHTSEILDHAQQIHELQRPPLGTTHIARTDDAREAS